MEQGLAGDVAVGSQVPWLDEPCEATTWSFLTIVVAATTANHATQPRPARAKVVVCFVGVRESSNFLFVGRAGS